MDMNAYVNFRRRPFKLTLVQRRPRLHLFGIDPGTGDRDAAAGGFASGEPTDRLQSGKHMTGLYTAEERRRRDASRWTLVQGVLAPLQFIVFLVSLALVLRFLATGEGLGAATVSVVIKTFVLYTIMVTGSIWEKEVFGVYLFARPFFWEDVFSMAVLALHTVYLAAVFTSALTPTQQMYIALAAYLAYVINAAQFVLKLRAARLQASRTVPDQAAGVGA